MKPFAGITVIELSTMVTASLASMMLADQGARVIKIEPIEMGDPLRYVGTASSGISSIFANCNRGKESIRVNLKSAQGQDLIKALARDADVLLHNYRPGVMDNLNLGSDQLRAINSKLIYVAISGFGLEGPLSSAPAYDSMVQAHCGMTAAQGKDSPQFIRNLMCDKLTAYTACQAASAALFARERSGAGQHIDISMLESGLAFIFPDGFMNDTLLADSIPLHPLLTDALHSLTHTSDGAITFAAATDEHRQGVVKAVSMEHLQEDPRFNTLAALVQNVKEYRTLLAEAFLKLSTEEALERLRANDVPCASCLSREQVIGQEQVLANNSIEEIEHPIMGPMRIVNPPVRFGGEQLEAASPCPAHGEHSHQVLASMGYDDAKVADMLDAGVIA